MTEPHQILERAPKAYARVGGRSEVQATWELRRGGWRSVVHGPSATLPTLTYHFNGSRVFRRIQRRDHRCQCSKRPRGKGTRVHT